MDLIVLGSSSSGNCYLLKGNSECLVIEAGIKFKEVQKAIDFDVSKITGCLVSHEHGDHAKYVESFLNYTIPVYCSQGTIDGIKFKGSSRPSACFHGKSFTVGNYKILPFDVQHDCNQPFGYLIQHPECGKILFMTDTYYCEYVFKGLNHILVEANYDMGILENNISDGNLHPYMRKRIASSHMSIDNTIQLLQANDLTQVVNVVLLHLSSGNSDAPAFKAKIEGTTGKLVNIAEKGLTINLNKNGF